MQVEHRIEHATDRRLSIELPDSFNGRDVEILIRVLDRPAAGVASPSRRPHPDVGGRVRLHGDILSTVPAADWGLPG